MLRTFMVHVLHFIRPRKSITGTCIHVHVHVHVHVHGLFKHTCILSGVHEPRKAGRRSV